MTYSKCIILLVVICSFYGCASSSKALEMIDTLPLHEESYDVDKRKIGSNLNQQLFFKFNDAYPSTDILNDYNEYFLRNNWRKCKGSMKGWESFIDSTRNPEQLVHQLVHYWVKENENKLGIISLRYYSNPQIKKIVPDNNVQNILVLMQKDVPSLENELSRLSVDCNQ